MADIDEERLRRELGENPVRYLDRQISAIPDNSSLFFARVKGIDKLAVIQSWIAVERNLERGPRDHVVEILERRKNHLLDVGERPDLLTTPDETRPDRYQRRQEDRDLPPTEITWLDQDGEEFDRSTRGVPKNDRLSKYLEKRKAEAEAEDQEISVASAGAGDVAVAPDGGELLDDQDAADVKGGDSA